MTALRSFLLAVIACLAVAAFPVSAQVIGPQLPDTVIEGAPDYDGWSRVAVRAERALESGGASSFALERLRVELATWRDQFLAAQSLNSSRIATVGAQIATLGAAPAEGDSEPFVVAQRRAELQDQIDRLNAPVVLAEEAYARANGMIGEIDGVMRMREAERLTTRSETPLDPMNWSNGVAALWQGLTAIGAETVAKFNGLRRTGDLWINLLAAFALLVVAGVLLERGRHWVLKVEDMVTRRNPRGLGVWLFLISLGQIGIPVVGMWVLQAALMSTGLLGYRGELIVGALPDAAIFVIVSRWLASHFFSSTQGQHGPLGMRSADRARGRRVVGGLGWSLTAGFMMLKILSAGDASGVAGSVLLLPIEIIVSVLLFRFGRLISRHCRAGENATIYRNRIIAVIGQVAMVLALVAPVLALFGYSEATQSILYPTVTTLAVLGLVLLLQRLVVDVYVMMMGTADSAGDALAPVLIGFVLLLLVMPILALTWGARESDLWELWSRFREGFAIGETRISPTDFIVFLLVFGLGYGATRFVQGTLRSTILPKTRLDIGGQNAVVSGVGYLGIFLAGVIAITTAGIDLSSLAIVAGALSVGIGFGLQNIVSNFVSGIILLIERPISEGDWIEVGGQMGIVRDISVRSTRIETFDRRDVIVPNADFVSGQVTNWTRGNLVGRIIVRIGVAYGTDTRRVEAILREIAEGHPLVLLSQPPNVVFTGFGADSLDFEVRALLRDVNFMHQTQSEIHHQIAERFHKEGIEIPFAQRDVWLRNPEALRPDSGGETE